MTQVKQTADPARSAYFAHQPEQFQIIQMADELLITYQPFFSRCTYRLQPEQLLLEHWLFGVQPLAIPMAALQAIRVIYHAGDEENPADWQLQLTWVEQQRVILSDSHHNGAPVIWLAEVLAVWAGFILRWKSPTTSAKLYDQGGSVDVVQGAEPAVSAR